MALRKALLDLHKHLIDLERRDYEKIHGPQSPGEFLQVMAYADSMRWLDPLSRLIVLLDEPEGQDEPAGRTEILGRKVREMLKLENSTEADFSSHYQRHFHTSAELAVAHGAVIKALGKVPGSRPG